MPPPFEIHSVSSPMTHTNYKNSLLRLKKKAALQFSAIACFQLFEFDGSFVSVALWDILLI